MKRFSIAAAVLALVCASACGKKDEDAREGKGAGTEPVATTPVAATPDQDSKAAELARGKYLVETVMNCGVCHTPIGPQGPDMSKHFAGGLEVKEVFGTWRSSNITPHAETGIGAWTDEQIMAAIREGKRPDGTVMAPIMPFMFYNAMSDADTRAVVAYLRTLPAIEHQVAPSELNLPPMPPAPKPAGADPDRADKVAYGAYLASLMKCGHCHTPMGEKGFEVDKMFAGGLPMELPVMGKGTLYSSNITTHPETGIGTWTEEQIIASITRMDRPSGEKILGPMVLFGMNWARMEKEDLEAVAAFFKTLPPIEHAVPASTFVPNAPPPGQPM